MPSPGPFRLGFLMFPGFPMACLTSAIEPLRLANRMSEKTLYKWTMHSVDGKPVAASNGILAMVDGDLSAVPESAAAQPAPASAAQPVLVAAPEPVVEQAPADDDGKPKKRGWWSLGR